MNERMPTGGFVAGVGVGVERGGRARVESCRNCGERRKSLIRESRACNEGAGESGEVKWSVGSQR